MQLADLPLRLPRHVAPPVQALRELMAEGETFKGMPKDPLSREELKRKFGLLMKSVGPASEQTFDHLASLEA